MPGYGLAAKRDPWGGSPGHKAVNGLFGGPLQGLNIDGYTNIIGVGPWGLFADTDKTGES